MIKTNLVQVFERRDDATGTIVRRGIVNPPVDLQIGASFGFDACGSDGSLLRGSGRVTSQHANMTKFEVDGPMSYFGVTQ